MAINQYAKEGNGPNAHKKGNRSNSKRNSTKIQQLTKRYGEEIDEYKRFAEARRNKVTYKQEKTGEVYARIKTYIQDRAEKEKPLTISGLQLAIGCSSEVYYKMKSGEYDYMLEQFLMLNNIDMESVQTTVDGIPAISADLCSDVNMKCSEGVVLLIPYSLIIQKALLMIAEQTEERLYSNGRVGDIFALKAQHGWQEEQSPQTVNQTLVIATEEQAREAIKLLK